MYSLDLHRIHRRCAALGALLLAFVGACGPWLEPRSGDPAEVDPASTRRVAVYADARAAAGGPEDFEPDDPQTEPAANAVTRRVVLLGTELRERRVPRATGGGQGIAEAALAAVDDATRAAALAATSSTDEVFALPVREADITSPFGMRRHPISGRRRMHRGVDFRGERGTPVYATASGRAVMAGYCDRGTGNCIVIDHPGGWRSQYFHLDEVHIPVNSVVRQGQHIGDIGSTGRSTGPHLHFQIGRVGGEARDPMTLIGEPLVP